MRPSKTGRRLIVVFVVSVSLTVAALVGWVVYVLGAVSRIERLASGFGMRSPNAHLIVMGIGVLVLAMLIVGLSLLLAQALAEQRWSRNQDEFVANVTHELKSPLAAIKLHGQSLELGDLDGGARRSVGYILKEAERMSQLVDNLLESSRIAAHRKVPTLVPIEVGALFDQWVSEATVRVESHGLELVATNELGRGWVRGSEEGILRVLDNLVENAVRFSSRGGQVRCRLTSREGQICFEVEDDGIGIPKAEQAKIFDRFYQIGREISGRRGGTGLGLSIVSGLVAEMNGSVRASSQEGRPGARFIVELPRRERA